MEPSKPVRVSAPPEPLENYSPEPEVHLRDYLYVLVKRRWVVVAVTVTALAVSIVSALRKKPVYTTTAVVQISRGKFDVVQGVPSYEFWDGYSEFYPTQQKILKSYNLAYRVVETLELWRHPFFGSGERSDPDPQEIKRLAAAVLSMAEVSQVRDTQLMNVSFTTPDPELSAQLANTLVAQYISFNSKTEADMARDTVSFLGEQIDRLEADIQKKEDLLRQFSRRDDIIMIDQKEDILFQQLKDLNQQMSQVRGELAAAEARYLSLGQADPASLDEVQANPNIQNLERRKAQLQERCAELSSRFRSDWPELQRTREALEEVERSLEQETREVARTLIEAARLDHQSVVERERLLAKAVDEKKREAQRLNQLTAEYKRIRAEVDNNRAVLDQLLRRHSQMGMSAERGANELVNIRLVDEAQVPDHPSGPDVGKSVMMGGLLGISLAIGLAFFLNYWDTSIYTVEDIRRYVPLPFLGAVPRYEFQSLPTGDDGLKLLPVNRSPRKARGRASPRGRGKDLVLTQSSLALKGDSDSAALCESTRESSPIGERFKFVRGSLLMSSPGRPPKTVLVTGPEKNAGKTFVACNLAASLAEMDKKVLLIDADLRNPQIHRIFDTPNDDGLSNLLTGQSDLDGGCIRATPIPNVFLVPAGRSTPSPSELLSSDQMELVLDECGKRFDFLVLDSAPLLPVFDAHMLTSRCDASVLVVRSGQTSRSAVNTSLDLVERVGGRLTGVVLNGVDFRDLSQSYYHDYYGYGYGSRSRDSENLEA